MKNILNVVSTINPKNGGVSEAIRNFEVGFNAINNISIGERHVLCLDNPDDVIQWDNKGLIVHAIGKVNNPWQYHKEMFNWLKTNHDKFDVIIVHGIWLYHSYAVFKLISFLKKQHFKIPRFFIMPHGMLDPWFQKDKTRRLKALRNDIYWKFIENKVINSADGLLFTCEQEKELASIPFPNYKPKYEYVVGLGIKSPPIFEQKMSDAFFKEYPSLEKKSYLLFLSRIDYKKGVDLLVEAYKSILQSSTEQSFSIPMLVIAGPGLDTNYGKSIYEMVNSNEILASKVIFTGMITGDVKWGALYGCEAFVLPSHQENFGIAVVEALACSKPVLISNQINIWKEIDFIGAGIVNNDTLDGSKKMINDFLELSSAEKNNFKEKAWNAYEKYFEISIASQKLANLILLQKN